MYIDKYQSVFVLKLILNILEINRKFVTTDMALNPTRCTSSIGRSALFEGTGKWVGAGTSEAYIYNNNNGDYIRYHCQIHI